MPHRSSLQSPDPGASLRETFDATRATSIALTASLSDADATIQSMEDASPAKWHLAHTMWFFETFLLRDNLPGYRLYDQDWPFLFNSYYEAEGARIGRFSRGMLSRPSLDEVIAYRAHVDQAMEALLANPACLPLIELGLAHEQQHQELLLTDIKHAMACNPIGPAIWEASVQPAVSVPQAWDEHPGGIALIGDPGTSFSFDNEGPRHRVLLEPFALARRLVTNREWDSFIADGGYADPRHWLSDGWTWRNRENVTMPLYWRGDEQFTHAGWQRRDPEAPVTHVSYYEAEAYSAWAGARLPTEFEWEAMAQADDPASGNQFDGAGAVMPTGGSGLFGDCWQWTRSAYLPYPRFRPADGAVGEYNGKFMSGQFVLKGASCATIRGHSRPAYRNFFYPHQRWQFTGVRLAKDI